MSRSLPLGWIEATLKDIVLHKKGKKPSKTVSENRNGYLPYILIDEMEGKPVRAYTSDENIPVANKNDVLIVWDGSIGKTATGIKGAIGSTIAALTPIIVEANFLNAFLQLSKPIIEQTSRGTGLQHINPTAFWPLQFPLPPLNEQKRIAAKLDKIMLRIDALKERLARIPQIIKRFRQAVLIAATSGELTYEWRKENETVDTGTQLLDEIISERESSKKYSYFNQEWRNSTIPNSWSWAFLSEIAELRLGKMLDKSKNIGNPTKYLRNINVRWFSFDLNDINEMKATPDEKQKLKLQHGDILVCEGGEPGRAAVWEKSDEKLIYQKALHRIRLKGAIESHWIVFNLKADSANNRLASLFTGTTIKHLTGKAIAKYPIPLPPLKEQKEIVRKVAKLFAFADKLEAHYNKAKEKIDKLPRSVLAKTFRGELVPQDPNDEPASELLKRIIVEKEKRQAEIKKTKKRSVKSTAQKKGK